MAETKANTFVNVNMIHGNHAGQTRVLPADFGKEFTKIPENIKNVTTSYVETPIYQGDPVVGYYTKSGNDYTPASGTSDGTTTYYDKQVTGTIDNAIGTIGNVFGGGKQGKVIGDAQVNIGSLTVVPIMKRINGVIVDTSGASIYDEQGKQRTDATIAYENQIVEGAHITGDVFGGGEEAVVTGNTEVFICANKTGDTTYSTVTEGSEGVTIGNGSVYGGGSDADVLGNTNVTMAGGYVFDGVYGGGLHGNVGTFTRSHNITTASNGIDHNNHTGCVEKPTACTAGGTCTVVVTGGQIGPVEVVKDGGGMKNTNRYFIKEGDDTEPVDYGFVFGAGRGAVENPYVDLDADFHTYVNETDVTIGGTALIMASVYGGGENGRVLGDTHVTIEGNCQIGCGEGKIDLGNIMLNL